MSLDHDTFLRIASGHINPGRQLSDGEMRGALDTSDMRQNLPILYALARGIDRCRVLEIGTSDGTSALAFLKAASEVGGHVTSVDVADVPIARALIEQYGLSAHWTFQRGPSERVLPALRDQGAAYDLVLIDGDHSYDGAHADLRHVEPMLSPGGVVLTHDSLMVTAEHDWSQPDGQQKCKLGCGILTLELLRDPMWSGMYLPFNCNLGLWRRRADMSRPVENAIEAARDAGLLTKSFRVDDVIGRRVIRDIREYPLGFYCESVGPGVQAKVVSVPQRVLRPERIVVPARVARAFRLIGICIDGVMQPTSVGVDLRISALDLRGSPSVIRMPMDTALAGNDIEMLVENITLEASPFQACLVCAPV